MPWPETDQRVGRCVVDFLWREQRVIAETDGHAYHSHRRAVNRDRRRTNWLQVHGYTVLRFTWHEVTRRPRYVLAQLREALAR